MKAFLKMCLAGFLAVCMVFTQGIAPALATPAMPSLVIGSLVSLGDEHYQTTINNSYTSAETRTSESWFEQVTKNAITEVATVGLIVGGCYLLDGAVSVPFPPAIALAPVCSAFGVGAKAAPIVAGASKFSGIATAFENAGSRVTPLISKAGSHLLNIAKASGDAARKVAQSIN